MEYDRMEYEGPACLPKSRNTWTCRHYEYGSLGVVCCWFHGGCSSL